MAKALTASRNGAAHPAAKLTSAKLRDVDAMLEFGEFSQADIARKMGVTAAVITRYARGQSYKDAVKLPPTEATLKKRAATARRKLKDQLGQGKKK